MNKNHMIKTEMKLSYTDDFDLEQLEYVPSYIPLGEAVFQSLKTAIIQGRIKPGQILSENKIAEKLSVSRTPVRESIRILEKEGLVTYLPGRKTIVSIPTLEDIKEVYDIRLIFEVEALRRITGKHKELIIQMEEFVRLGEKYRQKGEIAKIGEMNTSFHLSIISVLENKRVQQFIDSLHETISRFRFYYFQLESMNERENEHMEIVALLKKGSNAEAAALLQHHLIHSKENLIQLFSQKF